MLNLSTRFIQFFLLICLTATSFSFAEAPINTADLQKSFEQIQAANEKLDTNKLKIKDLDDIQKQYSTFQIKLDECINTNTNLYSSIQDNIKLLGEQQKAEEVDIKDKRTELENQADTADKDLKRCNLLKIQLNQMSQATASLRQNLQKKQLLSRSFSPLTAAQKLANIDEQLINNETDAIIPIFEQIIQTGSWPLLFLMLAGFAIGFLWRRRIRNNPIKKKMHSSHTFVAVGRGLKRTSLILLPLLFGMLFITTQNDSSVLLIRVLQFTLLLFFMYALIRGILFPDTESIRSSKISVRLVHTLSVIFLLFAIIAFAFSTEDTGRFSDSVILYLVWLISLIVAALCIITVMWIIVRNILSTKSFSTAYLIPMAAIAVSVIAALIGYRNLATLLFFGTLSSLFVLILAFLIIRISGEFFDSLDEGKIPWQKNLRVAMSIENNRAFPGILWLRILMFFVVVFTSISALMFIWGSSQQRISTLLLSIKDGVKIGSVNLDLINVVLAILILIITLSVLPFIKNQLLSGWLKHSNLSRGAKEATQTLVGYGGVAAAILWALYVIGVNFQNLAIIAGALSVGIGFGLQNIVNNFVSGLILLFERPIRRGDWIVVGNTEGYVRNISIRSTTIQTFERADVIVPNSELISSQVTNWMLSNTVGRLKAPVGVAYGSDVTKVMNILKDIAEAHPDVITNHPDFPIRVLFMAFGDNSLNFELRCFIKNVDSRLNVISAINQSIDREFRKANIEIPFPQRVVHMQKED